MHPLIKAVLAETDQQFWTLTGYKPGKRLDYRDRSDAAMIPVWLMIEHSVLVSLLGNLRADPDADPTSVQALADYKNKLDDRFFKDPDLLHRGQVAWERFQRRSSQTRV